MCVCVCVCVCVLQCKQVLCEYMPLLPMTAVCMCHCIDHKAQTGVIRPRIACDSTQSAQSDAAFAKTEPALCVCVCVH